MDLIYDGLRAVKRWLRPIVLFVFPRAWKHRSELKFWKGLYANRGAFQNSHFEPLFTEVYGLRRNDYVGKRVLDIGCGPLGSLEWADMTSQRVGLDPLALKYQRFGTGKHKMEYVASTSEDIPFPDGHFDIVTSLNSLDHVDDLDATIREIKRVLKRGGLFLLSVEIDHPATATEPITIDDAALQKLGPELKVVTEFRIRTPADHNLHTAVVNRSPPYVAGQPGIYVARYCRA